jgi:predicted amidohydrolase YtcJ
MNTTADTIFTNGSIITVDEGDRIHEAVAVAGNRIIQVGDASTVEKLAGPETEVIDLKGRSLVPGFIDAHCHPTAHGSIKAHIQCGPDHVSSIEDIKRVVAERAKTTTTDEWILGFGYDHKQLAERRHPTKWDLDEAAPNHRVCIFRTCLHMLAVSSLALTAAGYTHDSPDPEGGKLERNEQGELTGMIYERARDPFTRVMARPSLDASEKHIAAMNDDFLRLGITGAHDATGVSPYDMKAYQKCAEDGRLKVRIYAMARIAGKVGFGAHLMKTGILHGFGNERLRMGGLKMQIDGAGTGGTAALREHYPGDENNFGILHMEPEKLEGMVLEGHKAGYQIGIHAQGDKAIEITINAYEKALKQYPRQHHRHQIIHCGFLDEELMDRMQALRLFPALGSPFLYELGDTYIDIYGMDRLGCVFPLRSLLERGIVAPLTSDTPVIDPNPMHGIYQAVTRKTKSGQVIAPDETVSVLPGHQGLHTTRGICQL